MSVPTQADSIPRVFIRPDLSISRVLTGLWQIADMERDGTRVDPDLASVAMNRYVEAGLTTFDMADHYGSAELICGHYRSTNANAKTIETLTKWVPKPGPVTLDDARAAIDLARRRLAAERVDLLQFHTWTYDDPSWLDAMDHLTTLQREGAIGHLGLTNVDTAHLRMLLDSGYDVATNQVSFSLLDRRALQGLAPLAAERDVHLLAYGTLAGGLLSDRWLDKPEPSWDDATTPWSLNKYRRFIAEAGGWDRYQGVLRAARDVADQHDSSIAMVATRFIIDTPGVAGVIIGARLGASEHVDETVAMLQLELSEGDRAHVQAAIDALDAIPGDCGDEYRKRPFLTASGDLSHHLEHLPAPYPTQTMESGRIHVTTGTYWEGAAGYARATRHGDVVHVSGTTANHGDRRIGGDSAASQTHFILDKIAGALRSLGSSLDDVIRTRIFVRDVDDVEAVSRAHGQRLGHVRPANTLVLAGLVGEGLRVEIEAEAIVTLAASEVLEDAS